MDQVDRSRSIVARFRRDFFLATMLPLLCLLLIYLVGAGIAREHLDELISASNRELNADAERALQSLGETIIREKARDVADQLSIYLRMHPGEGLDELRRDPEFMRIAVQSVGETGYTAISDTAEPACIRVHPNPELVDVEMRRFADAMPSWWRIVRAGLRGDEVSGYYDWVEPDGSTRQKFLVATPSSVPVEGTTLMVSATAYIDEFSAPIVAMEEHAAEIDAQYQAYVSRQSVAFSAAFALLLLCSLAATYMLGAKSARRFIDPIGQLAEVVREFGAGRWGTAGLEGIIEREDEIGTLARTFQRMSAQTVELFNRLDQRVADLKSTQAALKESEDHYRQLYEVAKQTEAIYRSLIHSSADAIVMCDMDLQVTYSSPTFTTLFGWTQVELLGKVVPYIPDDVQPTALEILNRVLLDGQPFQGFETKRLTKDGRLIDVSISASRFDDHEGKPKGVLAIVRDLSDKKRVEAEMQRLGRLEAIGTLAGGVAHDFNNLLTVIQANVSILKSEIAADSEDYQSLLDIEAQVQSGSSLTRQLLGFARKGRYEVQVANINETVEKVANTVCRTRKDVVLHLDLAADLRAVSADLHQLEQVLLNLYINACDAMPDGGDLTVSTGNVSEKGEDKVVLRVQDTGAGMEPEIMDRIFDPFFTTKELGRGTGLGLASAYGIVESHGGRIEVDSRPGVGTTFRIVLPTVAEEAPQKPARHATVSRGRGTILIIDDEEMVLRACARLVRNLGYEVLTASSGGEGVEIYASHAGRIDLVILDMIMPGMNGQKVFERLKQIDPGVAVVISSGYSMQDQVADGFLSACRGRLQKPYSLQDLAEQLAAATGEGPATSA